MQPISNVLEQRNRRWFIKPGEAGHDAPENSVGFKTRLAAMTLHCARHNASRAKEFTPEAKRFYYQAQSTVEMLAARWADEKEYESLSEYQRVLEPIAKGCGVVILSMLKRPFGCIFTAGAPARRFKLTCGRNYRYQRIA